MAHTDSSAPARATYRHGDLRRTLIDAGIELARTGGPDAVVLREVTRRAGVVPNAAYRHFASRDDLLHEVRAGALAAVAGAMEKEFAAIDPGLDAAATARAKLRAVGVGYLRFAVEEGGLFRTAFSLPAGASRPPEPGMAGRSGRNPFELLGASLDAMVAVGALPPERRPGAEFLAWSAVHGLAMLLLDGPLAALPAGKRDAITERLIAMVEKGM